MMALRSISFSRESVTPTASKVSFRPKRWNRLYGFLFGLFACGGYSIRFFLFPLLTFLLVLKCTRIISLSSMLSAAAVVFYAWFAGAPLPVTLALVFFAALIVIRHRPNLIRMYRHEENKVSWI